MSSLKRLLDLFPKGAGQTYMKQVGGYSSNQGAKVIEPFHAVINGLNKEKDSFDRHGVLYVPCAARSSGKETTPGGPWVMP
jgi:hypothetical protein